MQRPGFLPDRSAQKRCLDLALASAILLAGAVPLALAAAVVRLSSGSPVLFRQVRVGRGGVPFVIYKLRTMRPALEGPKVTVGGSARVTPEGRFLRATKMDELPQLFNVLKGDMSLVGPRPPIAEEVAQYEPWQLRRLDVRPGITCLWQISGRSRIGFQEWMRLDLEYIRHRSLKLDFKILVRTIPAVLSREGAY